jgi:BlaI family transcriptional regulator, penicillinase repressor
MYESLRIDNTKSFVLGSPAMVKPRHPQPTAAELQILRVLWRQGPATVRAVQDELPGGDQVGYTTVLKLLQIMVEKGLVARDASARTHIYRAAVPEAGVKKRLVADLLDRAFDGSAMGLVMHALSAKPTTPDELRQLRAMLDKLEGDRS